MGRIESNGNPVQCSTKTTAINDNKCFKMQSVNSNLAKDISSKRNIPKEDIICLNESCTNLGSTSQNMIQLNKDSIVAQQNSTENTPSSSKTFNSEKINVN